jgi:hypothetical protein
VFVPVHAPAWQVSVRVQELPSLQAAPSGLAGLEQAPVAGSQVPASWHWSVGVHAIGGPGTQAPLPQVSPTVQALPSLHAAVLLTCRHPTSGSQESVVHGLPSSQFRGGVPVQVPFRQTPVPLHTSPSPQVAVLLVCRHPAAGSHESSVQTLWSLQSAAGPATQTPFVQMSVVVQASPSLHAVPFGLAGLEQTPLAGSQLPAR